MHTKGSFGSLAQQRFVTFSYMESVFSIASLHTETVNIWTHLLGTIWFCSSTVHFAITYASPLTKDAAAVLLYLVAILICFACSTLYHVFANHVEASSWLRADHFAIVCAIWASSISFLFFSFGCQQKESQTYAVLITSATAICLTRLSGIQLHDPIKRWSGVSTHAALGALAALPGLRYWYLPTTDNSVSLLADFRSLVVMNSIGGGIYATRLVDKTIGMELDLPDASHNIMHVMVVVGAFIYEQGLMSVYQDRSSKGLRSCV